MEKTIVHIAKITGIHGSEKHLLELLPELNKIYRIVFIGLTEPETPVAEYFEILKKHGIKTYTLTIKSNFDPPCFFKLFNILKRLKPCLVHTHLIHADIYATAAASLAGAGKIISTKHNDDIFRHNKILRKINAFFNRRTNGIIAISNSVARFISRMEAVDPGKIRTIYYGLSEPAIHSSRDTVRRQMGFTEKEIILIIVARLVQQKGHCYLIEAFSKAFEKNQDLRLLIVGDGELKNTLQSQVKEKKLNHVIHFTGYRKNIPDMLQASDIFVHPSLWEGFGLAILEAMACKAPVIATRVSAIPELVENNESGLLVPAKDTEELEQAITLLSADKQLRIRLGLNAHQQWKNRFSIKNMVKNTHKYYNEILNT